MTAPSTGVKDLLVAASIGTFNATTGWSIHIAKEPAEPHTCITVFDSGGLPPNPKWLLDYPSVQVRVRGAPGAYQAAYTKCVAIKNALLGLNSQDINGDRWVSVTMAGDINTLGFDESNRPMFSLNFRLILEPAPAAGSTRVELAD
jgi:hypothetical protein